MFKPRPEDLVSCLRFFMTFLRLSKQIQRFLQIKSLHFPIHYTRLIVLPNGLMKVAAATGRVCGYCSVLISSQRPTFLYEFYRGFIHSLQKNSGILACFRLDHDRFLLRTFGFASLVILLFERVHYWSLIFF
jgi:hypothetical protein